jgi:hypothetical protein
MSLFRWRVNCTVHGNQYIWDANKPTTCPLNNTDTINPDLTIIIDKREQNVVSIREENGSTGGHFKTESKVLVSEPNSTVTLDVTWAYPISVLEAYFVPTQDNLDDELEILVGPNTTIGVIMQPLTIGATSCVVSSTVLTYLCIGYRLCITNGVTMDHVGLVISINPVTSTVSFETATTNSYDAGAFVQMTIALVENYVIGPHNVRYIIGEGKIGGSYVPANTIARLQYINKSNVSKKFYGYIEYIY